MSIIDFFTQTPWWVYLILFYCLWIGIKGFQTRQFNIKKSLIIPILFLWMSLDSIAKFPGTVTMNASTMIIGLVIGALIGVMIGRHLKPRVIDRSQLLIETKGSWVMMVTIILIFVVKYYEGYLLAVQSPHLASMGFRLTLLLIVGLCTGSFMGRAIVYFWVMFKKEA